MNWHVFWNQVKALRLFLLALPVLCIAAGLSVGAMEYGERQGWTYESILNYSYQLTAALVLAILGLAIGFWAVFSHRSQGNWAFAVHRPVSPRAIFISRMLACQLVYLRLAVPPLVLGILWAAMATERWGPWDWRMAIPSIIDLAIGTVYVFAGTLVAAREARWHGSRILPISAAVVCSLVAWLPSYWPGIAAIAICWIVFTLAGLTAYENVGRESQPVLGRVFAALTMVPAAILLPIIPGMILVELNAPTARPDERRELFGTHLFVKHSRGTGGQYNELGHNQPTTNNYNIVSSSNPLPLRPERYPQYEWYRDSKTHVAAFSTGYGAGLLVRRSGVLAFYEIPEPRGFRRLRGYFGEQKIVQHPSQAHRFFPTSVYPARRYLEGIVETKQVTLLGASSPMVLFTAPEGETAQGASLYTGKREANDMKALATSDKATYAVDFGWRGTPYRVLWRYPHPEGQWDYVTLSFSPDLQTYALWYISADERDQLLVHITAGGKEIKSQRLPPPAIAVRKNPWQLPIQKIVVPPAVSWIELFFEPGSRTPAAILLQLLPAIASALAAWFVAQRKRISARERYVWIVLSLFGGIATLPLMLSTVAPRFPIPANTPGALGRPKYGIFQPKGVDVLV